MLDKRNSIVWTDFESALQLINSESGLNRMVANKWFG